jgi:excisionase family DNA binding protein
MASVTVRHKRTYDLRQIKATWPYTVPEAAKALGVHKNAVTRWLKEGLQANRDQRPYLIRGDALAQFLLARQKSRRQKCASDEFFCFKCRVPRKVYENIIDIEFVSPSRFRMKGICEVCSTTLNKMQGTRKLPKIQKAFHVQQLAGQHLIEGASPNLNSDKEPT